MVVYPQTVISQIYNYLTDYVASQTHQFVSSKLSECAIFSSNPQFIMRLHAKAVWATAAQTSRTHVSFIATLLLVFQRQAQSHKPLLSQLYGLD